MMMTCELVEECKVEQVYFSELTKITTVTAHARREMVRSSDLRCFAHAVTDDVYV